MKRLESIIIVIFLLMVCVAAIQQAQSWNNDGVVGIAGSNNQLGLPPPVSTVPEEGRQQYQRRIAKRLDELGARLKTLKTEGEKGGATKRKLQLRGAIRDFEHQLIVAQEQFEKTRSARAEEWGRLKSRMDAAMGDLNSSYERASAQAKQSRAERLG